MASPASIMYPAQPNAIDAAMAHVAQRHESLADGGMMGDSEFSSFRNLHQSLGDFMAAHPPAAMADREGNKGGQK
jgi:hypothetical protein